MATMTAQILIGSPHHDHDGIIPTHSLFLQENSAPAWILVALPLYGEHARPREVVWLPTVEDMLEDAFLMIAVHIVEDAEVIALGNAFAGGIAARRVEVLRLFSGEQRRQLYAACRALTSYPKLVVSAFAGSTILPQLKVIEQYAMDVEVCPSVYGRQHSAWRDETTFSGSLPPG